MKEFTKNYYQNFLTKISLNKKEVLKSIFAILFFVFLIYLVSSKMLTGVITFNDATFFQNNNTQWKEIASTFSPNYLGQDQTYTLSNYVPRSFLILFFTKLGFSLENVSYIMFFGPVFLAALVFYYIFYKLSDNYLFGILAGTFAVLNNLTLEYLAIGGTFYYFMGLISLTLLLYYTYKIYQKGKYEWKDVFWIGLISAVTIHPFMWAMFAITLAIYFLFHAANFQEYKSWPKYLATFVIIFVVQAYWILPFLYGTFANRGASSFGGSKIDAVYAGFKNISSYINNLNFFQYINRFSVNLQQNFIHYLFYFSIFILFLYISILNRKKTYYLFLITAFIIFYLLSLGPNSIFFGKIWTYFWEKLPVFGFFRSFPRFLIIIIPIYLLSFAIFVKENKARYKNVIIGIILIVLFVLNTTIISGNLKGTMVSTNIPKEYYQINDLLEKDSRNVNIASYPDTPYELYSWGQNDNPKVIRQDYYLKEYMFTKPVIYYRTTANYPGRENFMKDFFKLSDKTDENLVAANVGYVLIQKDRINPDNGGPVYYEEYDNYFKNNNNYELAMSNQYFNLYKNKRDTQEITGDNILYKKISSTKYKALITINNDDEKISLVKLNNPFWKAYVERNPNQKWCGQIIKGDKGECFPSNNYLDFGDFNYIFRKQSLNSLGHSNDYANEWVINKNLVNNLPKEYVQVNNDGSKSVEVTILFKPQLYLFAGLIITAVTIILLLLLTVILNNEKLVTLIGKRN